MTRMYAPIWARLKSNETVSLICPRTKALTITRQVYKEKSREKLIKDATEQLSFGRLSFRQEDVEGQPNKVRLVITLSYNGSNL